MYALEFSPVIAPSMMFWLSKVKGHVVVFPNKTLLGLIWLDNVNGLNVLILQAFYLWHLLKHNIFLFFPSADLHVDYFHPYIHRNVLSIC